MLDLPSLHFLKKSTQCKIYLQFLTQILPQIYIALVNLDWCLGYHT